MLEAAKLRRIYAQIQNELFNLIPEKWSKIYLYASVIKQVNNLQTGEMFFYYFPKGVLKKNPVNVYEVPVKFNADEHTYLCLVNRLYDTIKILQNEFKKSKEELWSSLTISIENNKFDIKYNYEDLTTSKYSSYDRHIIFKYEYLGMPIEVLSRKDRKMLETYYEEEELGKIKIKEYSEGMYNNKAHNKVHYDKAKTTFTMNEEKNNIEIIGVPKTRKTKNDKYEEYKEKQRNKKKEINIETFTGVNQILKYN